ncbi:EAL domain-containing protein [Herbiconiux liukaitaii]|uniref:EAL domain-containing protein n=1 Tax=Herbiconiux liukaitaii TaxID=3342799 RepID=UPI0035B6E982
MSTWRAVQESHFEDIVVSRAPGSPASIDTLFQPVVSLETRETVAYRAVNRPPRGSAFGSMQEILDHAEAGGRMLELDRALRRASVLNAARAGLTAPFGVLVSIQPESFRAGVALEGGGAGPALVVELSARALLASAGDLVSTIDRARDLGLAIGISIDGLRAEPAALALLPLLDPDVVTLDVSIIEPQPTGRPTVVIAEGIETEQQLLAARALGATHGRGLLFGPPERLPNASAGAASAATTIAGLPVPPRVSG